MTAPIWNIAWSPLLSKSKERTSRFRMHWSRNNRAPSIWASRDITFGGLAIGLLWISICVDKMHRPSICKEKMDHKIFCVLNQHYPMNYFRLQIILLKHCALKFPLCSVHYWRINLNCGSYFLNTVYSSTKQLICREIFPQNFFWILWGKDLLKKSTI